jgi:hypothetical protein
MEGPMAGFGVDPIHSARTPVQALSELTLPVVDRSTQTNVQGSVTTPLDPMQIRDAILLKTALEGKDFQTAIREVEAVQRAASPSGLSVESPQVSPPASIVDTVEITVVDVAHVKAEIVTPEGSLRIEATRLHAERILIGRRSQPTKKDPLVIDLEGHGPETTGSQGARSFDLDGTGKAMATSFVMGGSAFLALDRNGNGLIDSGLELFGDQHGAQDGYEELRKFDADSNGHIDSNDRVFNDLLLLHGDGRTSSLANTGITSFDLNALATPATNSAGDEILRSAWAATENGRQLQTYAMALQTFDRTVV